MHMGAGIVDAGGTHTMLTLLWMLACDTSPDTGTDTGACDDLLTTTQEVDCALLEEGVSILGLDGVMGWGSTVPGLRRTGEIVSGKCTGTATLTTWSLPALAQEGDATWMHTTGGCAYGEAVVQVCPASGALPVTLDPDVAGWTAEEEGALLMSPYTSPSSPACGSTLLPCSPGAEVRVVALWADAADVGAVECGR
jgi:hypothetical protein